jgi:hypothetical protein
VAHHGEAAYWVIGNKYKNVELEEKQKVIQWMQANKANIRASTPKIKQTQIQEISSKLMLDAQTDWETFHILCMYYNIRVILLFGNTYMDFTNSRHSMDGRHSMDTKTFVFHRSPEGYIRIPEDQDQDLDLENKIRIDYLAAKPMKAPANYTLPVLLEMATTLDIQLDGKPKKADWYTAIQAKLNNVLILSPEKRRKN